MCIFFCFVGETNLCSEQHEDTITEPDAIQYNLLIIAHLTKLKDYQQTRNRKDNCKVLIVSIQLRNLTEKMPNQQQNSFVVRWNCIWPTIGRCFRCAVVSKLTETYCGSKQAQCHWIYHLFNLTTGRNSLLITLQV